MKVLISNDDGVLDTGLWALAGELAKRMQVVIVAPDGQRSAVSHAITLHKPLRISRHKEIEKENISVYSTNGTPADSVMLGLLEIAQDADVIVSGINGGPNMGEDVLYSGTVAAAMEGALLGVPSVSVSLSDYENPNYELASVFAAGLVAQLPGLNLTGRVALNVNVPPVPVSEYKGFKVCALGTRKYTDILQKRIDPRGKPYYWVTGQLVRDGSDGNTDNAVTARGLVSITPLLLQITDVEMLEKLNFEDPMKLL